MRSSSILALSGGITGDLWVLSEAFPTMTGLADGSSAPNLALLERRPPACARGRSSRPRRRGGGRRLPGHEAPCGRVEPDRCVPQAEAGQEEARDAQLADVRL